LAHAVVERRVAACVNILPGVTSVYRWQGAVESATEHLLVIKTSAYLGWVADATGPEGGP
jgi:periplasmic divalent cation tolerance protein